MPREEAEGAIENLVQWLRLAVEAVGACIVALGVILGLLLFVRSALARRRSGFSAIRLVLARYLALALEFQLASDILSTAIAPSWDQIGKLGAIAIIRTLLNYFLGREIKDEQAAEIELAQPTQSIAAGGNNAHAGQATARFGEP